LKAAVFEGPDRLMVREVPDPACGSGDIVLAVHACGICGSDLRNFRTGLKGDVKSQIMGHELTGIVREVGREVSGYRVGDRIAVAPDVSCGRCWYCRRGLVNLCLEHRMLGTHWPGGFAEYLHLPRQVLERGMVHHVPEGVSLTDACLSEPAASVLAAQHNAGVGLGDTVLVIGDGPIGCLHVEVARARGASRVIVAGLMRLKEAERFAPDALIDAGRQDAVAETLRLTDGLGADVAICATPVAATQEQAVEAVRKRGKVVLFGGLPRTAPMTTLNSNLIHYNELTILGAFSYPATTHQQALVVIRDGKITPPKYFNLTVPLERIGEGFAAAAEGRALKVLVRPRKEGSDG
jgi:L-iditol 2-dehydrogenase